MDEKIRRALTHCPECCGCVPSMEYCEELALVAATIEGLEAERDRYREALEQIRNDYYELPGDSSCYTEEVLRIADLALFPQEEDMCPNCVTPWKCNGPHLSPQEEE